MSVEQVVDDFSVGKKRAAIYAIAARFPDRISAHIRSIFPPERIALFAKVECVQNVGPGSDDVHRAVDDQRLTLVPAENARGECPQRMQTRGIARVDLIKTAVAGRRIVLGRHGPLVIRARRRRATAFNPGVAGSGHCNAEYEKCTSQASRPFADGTGRNELREALARRSDQSTGGSVTAGTIITT